jgi:hypothetical protein
LEFVNNSRVRVEDIEAEVRGFLYPTGARGGQFAVRQYVQREGTSLCTLTKNSLTRAMMTKGVSEVLHYVTCA